MRRALVSCLAILSLLTACGPERPCYEDETKVMVVGEVLPDDRTGDGLDWGIGENVGKVICVTTDDFPDQLTTE